jgi:peptidyl-prolyl cis-trans isomerase-like 3
MAVTLHTSLGDIKFEVFCDTAPRTAFNFLALCASGAYDGTNFHRNMPGFMIQGGDPTGTGKGGESVWGGMFDDEFHPDNVHDKRGVVSMANKGPNSNRQQFFITYERQPHLNNVYTVFGRVLDGWDVLDQMERLQVMGGPKKSAAHRPLNPPVIQKVTIHANPLADEGIVYPSKTGPPEKRL